MNQMNVQMDRYIYWIGCLLLLWNESRRDDLFPQITYVKEHVIIIP